MNGSASYFASPDFSVTWTNELSILTLAAVIPVFVVTASHGFLIGLGVLQAGFLGLTEAIQWKLTKGRGRLLRIIFAVSTYLGANLAFNSIFILAPRRSYFLAIIGLGCSTMMAVTMVLLFARYPTKRV